MDKKPFDFDKYDIDPSVVVSKIWALLQSSLSNPEVTRLNAEISEKIFLIHSETTECHFGELLRGTSARSSAMSDVILVHENSQVERIIKELIEDGSLFGHWISLGYALGLETHFIETLRIGLNNGNFDFKEVLRRLVQQWMQLQGNNATVTAFCEILQNQQLILCKENVEQAFRQN